MQALHCSNPYSRIFKTHKNERRAFSPHVPSLILKNSEKRRVVKTHVSGPDKFLVSALEKVLSQINGIVTKEAQKTKEQREKAAQTGQTIVKPPGKQISFRAKANEERLVQVLDDAPMLPGRSLGSYLALPLDQYALLDPRWITRPDPVNAPGEFLLKVPLRDVANINLEPQISIRVDVMPEHNQVQFFANKFLVGDPRIDQDFELDLKATLRHRPADTSAPSLFSRLLGRSKPAASTAVSAPSVGASTMSAVGESEPTQSLEPRQQQQQPAAMRAAPAAGADAAPADAGARGGVEARAVDSGGVEGGGGEPARPRHAIASREDYGVLPPSTRVRGETVEGGGLSGVEEGGRRANGLGGGGRREEERNVGVNGQHAAASAPSPSASPFSPASPPPVPPPVPTPTTASTADQGTSTEQPPDASAGVSVGIGAMQGGPRPPPPPSPPPPEEEAAPEPVFSTPAGYLKCEVDVRTSLLIPHPLSVVPTPVLTLGGSLTARITIKALLPTFLELLSVDFARWTKGQQGNRSKAAGSLIARSPAGAPAQLTSADMLLLGGEGAPPRGAEQEAQQLRPTSVVPEGIGASVGETAKRNLKRLATREGSQLGG